MSLYERILSLIKPFVSTQKILNEATLVNVHHIWYVLQQLNWHKKLSFSAKQISFQITAGIQIFQ